MIKRVVSIILKKGFFSLFKSVFFTFVRRWQRLKFRILYVLNYERYKSDLLKQLKGPIFFERLCPEIEITEEQIKDALTRIESNKFLCLSPGELDFSKHNDGPAHTTINWALDPVSDRTWDQRLWGPDIPIQTNAGDIKRPWEIGRLHVLVQLAQFHQATSNIEVKKSIEIQFDRILNDFLASNPCYYGPQWMCAMDVGIRLSNIVMAFQMMPESISQKFQTLFFETVFSHVFFIENNLENRLGYFTNNHYLANLTGLAFGYSVLQKVEPSLFAKKSRWLFDEIEVQINQQFLRDGGNFEGSTMYHRLSLELILFGLAALLDCHHSFRLMPTTVLQLKRALSFSESISDFENQVPQIGDNDSGHLFLLNEYKYKSNDLSHVNIINALNCFLEKIDPLEADHKQEWSGVLKSVMRAFSDDNTRTVSREPRVSEGSLRYLETTENSDLLRNENFRLKQDFIVAGNSVHNHDFNLSAHSKEEYSIESKSLLFEKADFFAFVDFGLYVVKSDSFHLTIRCGHSKNIKHRGHEHFDQLSINLKTLDGLNVFDPGTFCYTSDTRKRSVYRGPKAHRVPYSREVHDLYEEAPLFDLPDYSGQCLQFDRSSFVGRYEYKGQFFQRRIQFQEGCIKIEDYALSKTSNLIRLDFHDSEAWISPRYGVEKKATHKHQ